MSIFTGAAVAIATPMNEDFSVNYEKLDNLIEFQIENGTDAIVICGTTGEASTLSHEEHLDVVGHCIKTVKGRVPVIAGTGSNSTETAIYLSTEAEKLGADAVLLVTPYYNKATQKGLYEHFKDTADAINIPCILYNVPSRTGCNILPETAVKLARDVKNIVAIKEASGNISQIAKLMQLADGCIDVYSGNDDQIVPIMSLGGLGVISVLSNVAPAQTHELCQACLDGDFKKAAKMQLEALPLIDSLFSEVNPIPVKHALNVMGFEAGPLRKPLTEMEEDHAKILEENMKEYGLY
ncbi:MAG: 4-hydroxy-tetrahydrodipicolinate synthase [Pseudobutyrivibrio sp.]|nr:4-hydroxy-tetrahydrodipicolinate synthase [Pseudobutyrivibrio sp.]